MSVKKTHTIPFTKGRTSQSVDFSGYIYPQFMFIPKKNDNTAIQQLGQALLSDLLAKQNINTFAGVTRFDKNYTKDVYQRKQLGNYEYWQSIPGTIGINLNLDKVVFYKNEKNILDEILQINYDGAIKQTAPLMIIENMGSPDGDIKTIIHLDCWVKSSKINYPLSGDNVLVVNGMNVSVTRTFMPIDVATQITDTLLNKFGLSLNNLNYTFNQPNVL
jgi:hypothetical protein